MKTQLPEAINTIDEAKQFLTALRNNNESYCPEDDAREIVWETCEAPTPEECKKLNKLMGDIYKLEGNKGVPAAEYAFCPCGFLIGLDDLSECASLYQTGGVVAVCDYANERELEYKDCKTCNASMPNINDVCAVCGQK